MHTKTIGMYLYLSFNEWSKQIIWYETNFYLRRYSFLFFILAFDLRDWGQLSVSFRFSLSSNVYSFMSWRSHIFPNYFHPFLLWSLLPLSLILFHTIDYLVSSLNTSKPLLWRHICYRFKLFCAFLNAIRLIFLNALVDAIVSQTPSVTITTGTIHTYTQIKYRKHVMHVIKSYLPYPY